jgi:hypothetical protein
MLPVFIAVVIFVILIIYLIVSSINNLEYIYLLINIPLLFVVIARSYFAIRHRKILYHYWIGLGITTTLFLVFFKYLHVPFILWQVLFVTMVFIIAEIIINLLSFYKKFEINSMFKDWINKRKK